MHLSLSDTNLTIVLVASLAVVLNAVASSRLAPMIAALFARLERGEHPAPPSHRGA